MVVVHRGLAEVYLDAERAGAFAVSQLPNCAMEPAIFTVWPTTVVVLLLNVTATLATGVAQPVAAAVELVLVEVVAKEETLLVLDGVVPDDPVI